MLDAEGFGGVDDVFALDHFGSVRGWVPVVCYEEDGVGALQGGSEAGFGVEISLYYDSISF